MKPSPPAGPQSRREVAARLEAQRRWTEALEAYEAALLETPDEAEIVCGLARIALQLDMAGQGLELWRQALRLRPESLEAVDGQARALAALERHDEAVEVLRTAILAQPHEARLWNALGVLLTQQGESAAALTFFEEAVRLEPGFAAALYNIGDVRFDLGELAQAETALDAAARHATGPEQTTAIVFARALLRLHGGELGPGWDAYEARLSSDHPVAPVFVAPGVAWTPQTSLDGAHLLVVSEQGIGDEVMFAGLLPDVMSALGPTGRLSLAVEPRLTTLIKRSFPAAHVIAHTTERRNGVNERRARPAETATVDLWAPMGSLPRRFRPSIEAFGGGAAYLRPDWARLAHWRDWLAGVPRPVGLSWRSGLTAGRRRRQYPSLAAWTPVLRTRGVSFINLQYGATAEELFELETLAGCPILTPPDIDLRADLDDLAALCAALDLLVSVPNATAAIAGACGTCVWFLAGPAAWTRLGTDRYPWYADTRSFEATGFGAWQTPMAQVADALEAWIADRR